MQTLAELIAAVSTAHAIHAAGEATNVRAKLTRLTGAVAAKPLKPYPIHINTRAKAYGIGLGMFVVLAVVFYVVFALWSPSVTTLLKISLGLLIATELFTLVSLDKYHVAIQKLINTFDKKK